MGGWVQGSPKEQVMGGCACKVLWDLCKRNRKRPSAVHMVAHPIKGSKGWAGFKGLQSEQSEGPTLVSCTVITNLKFLTFEQGARIFILHGAHMPGSQSCPGAFLRQATIHGVAWLSPEESSCTVAAFLSGAPLTDWENEVNGGF